LGAVWFRAQQELRGRWQSTLALVLLIGLSGAVGLVVANLIAAVPASIAGQVRPAVVLRTE
jgi:hypothetical protein